MLDLTTLNNRFENATPEEILTWAWQTFDSQLAITSSFQTQSVPLLHMIARAAPELPVLFVDTGFHFPETVAFRHCLAEAFNLNVIDVRPPWTSAEFIAEHGEMYKSDPDLCCRLNKVEPLETVLAGYKGWLSGIRRDQTSARLRSSIVVWLPHLNLYKINPLANWTSADIYRYIEENQLPLHPLWNKGYRSIGCAPCTAPTTPEQEERAGRWPGMNKCECGLHSLPAD
jgi:phosphoadenosine phosphosulfate reductase